MRKEGPRANSNAPEVQYGLLLRLSLCRHLQGTGAMRMVWHRPNPYVAMWSQGVDDTGRFARQVGDRQICHVGRAWVWSLFSGCWEGVKVRGMGERERVREGRRDRQKLPLQKKNRQRERKEEKRQEIPLPQQKPRD